MPSSGLLPDQQTTTGARSITISGMATQIRKRARVHLYITEWMEYRGLNDERMGERIGVDRATIHRRRKEQHRLNPAKIAEIADALDVDSSDLYRLPPRLSIDSVLKDAPSDVQDMVFDLAMKWTKKG